MGWFRCWGVGATFFLGGEVVSFESEALDLESEMGVIKMLLLLDQGVRGKVFFSGISFSGEMRALNQSCNC